MFDQNKQALSTEFYVSENKILFYIASTIITTSKRIIIQESEEPLKITSISRNSKLLYEGNIEFQR